MCTDSTTRSPTTARRRPGAVWRRAADASTPGARTPPDAARTGPGVRRAGYWHYHDHVVGTEHGTGGIHKGLYGPVIVRRVGDLLPDKTFTIVFNETMINQQKHEGPDLPAIVGERVEFVMITHGDLYHTFHLHGHRGPQPYGPAHRADDPSQIIDNRIVGPGDSFGSRCSRAARRTRSLDVPLPCATPRRPRDGGPLHREGSATGRFPRTWRTSTSVCRSDRVGPRACPAALPVGPVQGGRVRERGGRKGAVSAPPCAPPRPAGAREGPLCRRILTGPESGHPQVRPARSCDASEPCRTR